ncbi:calcium-binding protein [Ensifer soli]|uniref:calcium-binding protein n=1 Tax=Ciceribacter sp. sgz301302 TaxID=3342379 RepID=UPI0035B82280
MLNFDIAAGMWGANGPRSIDYDFRDFYFSASGSPEARPSIGLGDLASLGVKIGLRYDFGIGLVGRAKLELGSIDARLGIETGAVASTAETTLNAASFIDTRAFAVSSATLGATGIDIANSFIDVDFETRLKADIYGGFDARVLFETWSTRTFGHTLIDYRDRVDLVTINGGDIRPYTFDYTYGRFSAQLPTFSYGASEYNAAGGPYGALFLSGRSTDIASVTFDVDAALLTLFGLPPNTLSGGAGFDWGFLKASIDYKVLDAQLRGTATLEQEFAFKPTVDVTMTSSFGEVRSGKLGDRFAFETPEGEGTFEVDAAYTLSGELTSTTFTRLSSFLDYRVLEGRLAVNLLGIQGSVGFGPLLNDTLGIGGGLRLQLFSNTSRYTGQTVTETYTVSYERFVTAASGAYLQLTSHQVSVEGGDIDNTIVGNARDNTLNGHGGHDTILGNEGNDTLDGGDGNDTLDGGAGEDVLVGGLGDDTFVLSDGQDTVSDADGVDTITSTISRSLAGHEAIENLVLLGRGAIDGTGNALDNVITGNAGANVLDGGGGADTLIGGRGNDTYVVDGLDRVVEAAGGGRDTVIASLSVTLAAHVEDLVLSGTQNIHGTGNALANRITGNDGANRLKGEGGNDVLSGGNGNDVLAGGLGRDTLTGGAGRDTFLFDTAPSRFNLDVITDFSVRDDTIRLAQDVFAGLSRGKISADAFARNTTGRASDADHRIIYETDTGKLFYDANGSKAGGSVQFATLEAGLRLTTSDLFIV